MPEASQGLSLNKTGDVRFSVVQNHLRPGFWPSAMPAGVSNSVKGVCAIPQHLGRLWGTRGRPAPGLAADLPCCYEQEHRWSAHEL